VAVRLHGSEKELLELELAALADQAHDEASRERYRALAAEVAGGEIAEEHENLLEAVLELLVQSGRARKLYGPGGEQALAQLYGRTPRGRALAETVNELNKALEGLAGQTLEGISIAAHGPSAYRLQVETDQGRLSIRLDGAGARAESLEVGI
jgi:hypothetical protein